MECGGLEGGDTGGLVLYSVIFMEEREGGIEGWMWGWVFLCICTHLYFLCICTHLYSGVIPGEFFFL